MVDHFYNEVLREKINGEQDQLIHYMRSVGLLKWVVKCQFCNVDMVTCQYQRHKDAYAFRCMNRQCSGYKKYHSLRTETFFSQFSLSLAVILEVCYRWICDFKQTQILDQVAISKKSLVKLISKLRNQCSEFLHRTPVKLGGDGVIVQIDESLMRHKPKYHRGRAPQSELWVFGIADTSVQPAKVYIEQVSNRRSETLLQIVEDHVIEGSIIQSDQWPGYSRIRSDYRWILRSVNHSENFVDPLTGVHTQNIESCWNRIKLLIKSSKGLCGHLLDDFLAEVMWKFNNCRKQWSKLVELLRN